MLSSSQQSEFENCFPFIKRCSPDFVGSFIRDAQYCELPANVSICDEGQHCSKLAMVVEGNARVFKLSSGGREVSLYRIYRGESCVLTASCIMNNSSFPAMAETETPIRAVLISPDKMVEWFCEEPEWRQFVFGLLSHRLSDIISVIEEVAFKRIDVRLAEQFSRSLKIGDTTLVKTHAEIAADVGSSREVISRILKDFSERGMIATHRGHIEILDSTAIEKLAKQ